MHENTEIKPVIFRLPDQFDSLTVITNMYS